MTEVEEQHSVWLTTRSYGVCRLIDVDWDQRRVIVALSGQERGISFEEVTGTVSPPDQVEGEWRLVGHCPDNVLVEVFYRLTQAGLQPSDPYDTKVRDKAYQAAVQLLTTLGVAAVGQEGVYEEEAECLCGHGFS